MSPLKLSPSTKYFFNMSNPAFVLSRGFPSCAARTAPRACFQRCAQTSRPLQHQSRNTGTHSLFGSHRRSYHASSALAHPAPRNKDRGPASKEDTQTDFNTLNILQSMPAPTTAIHATQNDGFALDSGLVVTGCGVLLVAGDAFRWKPWIKDGRVEGTIGEGAKGDDDKGLASEAGKVLNEKGQFEVDEKCWGVFDLVWPKPDLLILGTGKQIVPVSPATRKHINDLGIRLEVQDTRNAAAQYNLLATERGVQQVAAALIPIGWREGR
ncbi:hypothetical protein M8818_006501 [Zalaria obscura]|uniref:Uncharacterized protein n=1 Tax=Zalaria obscura TaxID=2024903 RepID=A0ACC3S640_9PEZI